MEPSLALEKFQNDLLETYTCIICREYAVDIQTSKCPCNVVFCTECAKPVNECPICHKNLKLLTLPFRILNFLKNIPAYKEREEKYKEEQIKKVPSIKDITERWEYGEYQEQITEFFSGEEVVKAQEISRRLIYNLINIAIILDDDGKFSFSWNKIKGDPGLQPEEYPIVIMTISNSQGSSIGRFRAEYTLPIQDDKILSIWVIFKNSLKNTVIPYNLFDLYYLKN